MKYLTLDCRLCFIEPVRFTVNPLFLIRSILGNSLRHECCSSVGQKCRDCESSSSCVYDWFFEGIRPENGKGMRMHPYSLRLIDNAVLHKRVDKFDFGITLYGDEASIIYPYIYIAFVKAGQHGILRDRIPFAFQILGAGDGSKIGNESIKDSIEIWSENASDYDPFSGRIRISMLTPLRFQYGGHYGLDFTKEEFFSCLSRRMNAMISVFGESEADYHMSTDHIGMEKHDLRWVDYSHYSARQKTTMMLGGVMGDIELEGDFSSHDMMILDFAEKFSVGKNAVFGLGNIEIWKKEAR